MQKQKTEIGTSSFTSVDAVFRVFHSSLAKGMKLFLALNILLLSSAVQTWASPSAPDFHSSYLLASSNSEVSSGHNDQTYISNADEASHEFIGLASLFFELEEETEEERNTLEEETLFIDNALISRALIQPHVLNGRLSFLKKQATQADAVACYLLIREFRI